MEQDCVSIFFANSALSIQKEEDFECSQKIDKSELEELCEDIDMAELCKKIEESEQYDASFDNDLYDLCEVVEKKER